MNDIVAFLTAQYDKDERIATAAAGRAAEWWDTGPGYPEAPAVSVVNDRDDMIAFEVSGLSAPHIARHDPARVLAEVAAKRRRLERHQPEVTEFYDRDGSIATFTACEICGNGGTTDDAWPCVELRDDAAPYAAETGYDESWRP